MPTYRITDRTGKVVDPAVQADSDLSALSGYDADTHTATQTSANPPAMVYTVAFPLQTARGGEIVEVSSTGSRTTALQILTGQPPGRTLIEETPEANRSEARKRRS